jgi:hypothetical protein
MKKLYPSVRALHLYIGLFISTLVVIFAVSVLVFNHQEFFNKICTDIAAETHSFELDSIPVRGSDILTAKAILSELKIAGEVDYINKTDSSMSFPVNTTRKTYSIRVNKLTNEVFVITSSKNIFQATTYLHSMPGPHNINIRGNSGFIKLWRYLIDIIVYSVLFLTVSGIFMWCFYRSERKWGIVAAVSGIFILLILIFLTF